MNRDPGPSGANETPGPRRANESALDRLIRMVRETIFLEQLEFLYKVFFLNLIKSALAIYIQKKFPRNFAVIHLEAIVFTTFYYLSSYDLPGGILLLVFQMISTFMIHQMSEVLGTAMLLAIVMTGFSGFADYVSSQYLCACLVMGFKLSLGKYPPSFLYIVFYLCNIVYAYSVGFRFIINNDDYALAILLCGCTWCVYDNKYYIGDIFVLAATLIVWMYLCSRRVQPRYSLMRPALPPDFFLIP